MNISFTIKNRLGKLYDGENLIKIVENADSAAMQQAIEEHVASLVTENPQLGIEIAITKGEQIINNFFSTSKLLQMKMWWDTLPRESTPKLNATYQWIESITSAAISGSTNFNEPPHTFLDIAQESMASSQ